MKFALVFISLLAAGAAEAQTYLCSDGTYITRESKKPVIRVVIDGTSLECKLTTSAPGPGMCSASSENVCVGQRSSWGDCRTKFGEYGKCFAGDKLGEDGNAICGCGVGE